MVAFNKSCMGEVHDEGEAGMGIEASDTVVGPQLSVVVPARPQEQVVCTEDFFRRIEALQGRGEVSIGGRQWQVQVEKSMIYGTTTAFFHEVGGEKRCVRIQVQKSCGEYYFKGSQFSEKNDNAPLPLALDEAVAFLQGFTVAGEGEDVSELPEVLRRFAKSGLYVITNPLNTMNPMNRHSLRSGGTEGKFAFQFYLVIDDFPRGDVPLANLIAVDGEILVEFLRGTSRTEDDVLSFLQSAQIVEFIPQDFA